jgi:DNA-binding MarR family transcriptional regulator
MARAVDVLDAAASVRSSLGVVFRRLRQTQPDDGLTFSERSALARLEQGGPATAADLARLEQISPQSIGATVARLEARGLVDRVPDADDGRRVRVALTEVGRKALRQRRSARTEQLARALEAEFTDAELRRLLAALSLLERLAERL